MSGNLVKGLAIAGAVGLTGGAAAGALGAGAAGGAAGGAATVGGGTGLIGTSLTQSMGLYSSLSSVGTSSGILGTGISGMKALQLGGLALSAAGQFQSAQAADANARFNARLNEFNAKQREIDAKMALRAAQADADATRRETRRRIGSIRTAQAKSGVVTSEGSPLLAQSEQFAEGEQDALRQLYRGNVSAQGFRQQAGASRLRAAANRSNVSGTGTNLVPAGAGLLTGVGSVLE